MKVMEIDKDSPFYGEIKAGDKLVSVDDEPVEDSLDCMFKLAGTEATLLFVTKNGEEVEVEYDGESDLGIEFEQDKIKVCRNKCIFCFVHQQPKGMRRSLYLKDEDFRLSFTHGNFISFSNLSDADIDRIISQRLSPLYVSIHTTDDDLRRHLFQNKKLKPIMPQLKKMVEHGISFHTQVVVCPDINDGKHLEKTINDLAGLYPGVETLGVVPVGLTKYREKLPQLRSFSKRDAIDVLDLIHSCQKKCLHEHGTRFVFGADELYIKAELGFPPLSHYEEMEQFENGIGMMRSLITDFNRRKKVIKKIDQKICFITGLSAYQALKKYIINKIDSTLCRVDLLPVKNRFWGKGVTVSGLLTGRDIVREINKHKSEYDIFVLPPNCLNNDDLFLDDMPLSYMKEKFETELTVGKYSIVDTLKELT